MQLSSAALAFQELKETDATRYDMTVQTAKTVFRLVQKSPQLSMVPVLDGKIIGGRYRTPFRSVLRE